MTGLPPGVVEHALKVLFPDENTDPDYAVAADCCNNLRAFIREAWPIVEPATEFVPSWHIDCVAEHLQAVSDGEILRLIINQPPRTTKSLTTAVFWPAWEWLTKPHLRWLFASYAGDFAQRDSLKMRRLIKSQGGRLDGGLFQRIGYQGILRLLGESWGLEKDQDAKRKYETTATGMRFATSVGGMATGEGGDRIVVDDPVNAKQARSVAERDSANVWWDETMTTRFNNAQAAAVIVMQRLHQDDLTGHLLEKGGWHHLCLPAEYEPAHPFVYPSRVKLETGREIQGDPRTKPGELLDPERLGPDVLADRQRDLGAYGYAGQYQQQPSPAEGGMFKREWWARRWEPGFEDYLDLGWDRLIQSWDMRFGDSQKATSSYVVGQVWGYHGPDVYLLAQIRGRLSFTDTLHAVRALTAMRPEATAKLVERKANGEAVMSTLRREIPGLIGIEPQGGKDVRAAAISPLVEAGNVILPMSDTIPCPAGFTDDQGVYRALVATTVTDFVEEAAIFPNGAHDDQVDGMSQVLAWAPPAARAVDALPVSSVAPVAETVGLMDRRL